MKFIIVILHEETGLYLTFSKQNFMRHTTVSKHLSTTNSIFKATALTDFNFNEGITKIL